MALNDTFIKNSIQHSGKPTGDKHADGGGMYLLVKAAGKYWRWDHAYANKRKTLALGVYPIVGLADARKACDKARKLLAQGIDPSTAKREAKQTKAAAAASTFELVARAWLEKTAPERMASTQDKIQTWLEKDLLPFIGPMPIGFVGPRDVLATVRKMEARGAIDSAHRIKQLCGQVLRFAVATGSAERDVTVDLKGALAKVIAGHHPAITEHKQFGALMRSIANGFVAQHETRTRYPPTSGAVMPWLPRVRWSDVRAA